MSHFRVRVRPSLYWRFGPGRMLGARFTTRGVWVTVSIRTVIRLLGTLFGVRL
jgi:hypothetical protein